MTQVPDRNSPYIVQQARSLRLWVDERHDAGHPSSEDELWAKITLTLPRADPEVVEAILYVTQSLPRQASRPQGFDEVRSALLDTLRSQCDGTWSDDTSRWSLQAGSGAGAGVSIDDLVDTLSMAAIAATAKLTTEQRNERNSEQAGTMIKANIHSDNYVAEADFDAAPYFEQASEAELLALASIDFRGDYAADYVAEFVQDLPGYEGVAAVFTYLAKHPKMPNGDTVGFEVVVDPDQALSWIEANRPEVAARIRSEEAAPTP